jgi:DNA mismatch endonuclease (patch repair protein)
MPGRPDLVLSRWRAVVFVHGCYWHGHPNCRFFRLPQTRTEFWREKIDRNRARDLAVQQDLRRLNWRVAVIWECALRDEPDVALGLLESFLRGTEEQAEIRSKASLLI